MSLRAVRDINGDTLLNEGTVEDISDRKVAEEWVQFLAYYDALTGLPNRTLLRDRLSQALASARRRKDKVALLFLDLDRFKIVNDSLGHSVGDLLLKEVAARLKRWAREQDTVARLGGDEFLIVLTDVKDIPGAAVAAERLMDAMIAEFVVQGHPLMVSCSLGISIFPEHVRAGDKGSHSGRFGPEPVIHQREPRWRGRGKNFTAVSKLVLPRVPCVLRGIWILLRD
jgi:diguanylate cyclase (GGDEF)-like protein